MSTKNPSGFALALALAVAGMVGGCGGAQKPGSEHASKKSGGAPGGGEQAVRWRPVIPKTAKREISEDARAEFEKVLNRYLAAEEGRQRRQRVFEPGARLWQGRRREPRDGRGSLQSGRRLAGVWQGRRCHQHLGEDAEVRPRDHQPGLGGVAQGRCRSRRVAVPAGRRGRSAAHDRGAQQPGADPARSGASRRVGAARSGNTSGRRSPTSVPFWRSTATTSRPSRPWRSSTTT